VLSGPRRAGSGLAYLNPLLMQVDASRVVVAGRQSFGCIAMPDFLAALAEAVKPNGARAGRPARGPAGGVGAAGNHARAACWGCVGRARVHARLQGCLVAVRRAMAARVRGTHVSAGPAPRGCHKPLTRPRGRARRDLLPELPAHVHPHGRAAAGRAERAAADDHRVQARAGAPAARPLTGRRARAPRALGPCGHARPEGTACERHSSKFPASSFCPWNCDAN